MSKLAWSWLLLLGMVVVTGASITAFVVAASAAPDDLFTVGLAFLALVVGLAAVAFFLLRWRAFAIGLVAGYALLSLLSGGVCTLLNAETDSIEGGYLALFGAVAYVLALGLAVLVLGIVSIVAAARK